MYRHTDREPLKHNVTETILPEKKRTDGQTDGRIDTQLNTCYINSTRETDIQTRNVHRAAQTYDTGLILPEKDVRTDRQIKGDTYKLILIIHPLPERQSHTVSRKGFTIVTPRVRRAMKSFPRLNCTIQCV